MSILLARSAEDLPAEVAGAMPEWAAGLAFPGRGLLAVRLDRLNSHPGGSLSVVVAHELVHLAMGLLPGEHFAKLPWWFHEGVAQYLSDRPYFEHEADLASLAAADRLRDLDRLGGEERLDRRATDLAYQQAWSFARFLADRCGRDVFARILAALAERPDFNLAFLEATGRSYVSLEAQWKALLLGAPGATMLQLAQQFFLILLVFALPLVALALIRRFRREEEIEARWQAEERADAGTDAEEAAQGEDPEADRPAGDD